MPFEIKNGKILSITTVEREDIEYLFIKYEKADGTKSHYPLLFPIANDVKQWVGKYLQVWMDGPKKIEQITNDPIPTNV